MTSSPTVRLHRHKGVSEPHSVAERHFGEAHWQHFEEVRRHRRRHGRPDRHRRVARHLEEREEA